MFRLIPLPPIIYCFIKIEIGLTFLMPAYPGGPGKETVKRVPVYKIIYLMLIIRTTSVCGERAVPCNATVDGRLQGQTGVGCATNRRRRRT